MKTLERYVFGSFLTAFFLAWLILSFVLTIGLLVKIVELLIEGLPAKAVGTFILVSFPWTLFLTVPVGLLVSALLVFSRLSVDSEIAAMRACGVNLLQIIRWPLLFGAVCAAFCVWVNNEIVPRSHEMQQNLKSFISVDAGLDLLEPGRIIDDFEKFKVYFEKREGNWLYDLRVFDNSDPKGTRVISANKALVATNGTDLVLDLYKVSLDPVVIGQPGVSTVEHDYRVIPNAMRVKQVKRKLKDLPFNELRAKIAELRANPENLPKKAMRVKLSQARTEFHVRLVYAAAAFCFVLIGVPLGIKTQRKESSVGIGISLAVALVYYLFVILALSMDKHASLQPYLFVWIPVGLCGLLACYLIPKNL